MKLLYQKFRGKACSCSQDHVHKAEVSFAPDAVIMLRGVALGACLLCCTEARAEIKKDSYQNALNAEQVHVRGVAREKIADKISGVKADYLNKEADLGPLGKQKLEKAPFSVMQTSHDVLENQQLRTMDQAFDFMPSVQLQIYSTPSPQMVNRGFQADIVANSRVDGLNVRLGAPYTTEMFENMTVLNGAAGSMYGPESPSGVVDMTLKRPTSQPFFNFNFGYDSNGAPLESLDTSLGKGPVKMRFNYMNQTGQSYVSTSNIWRNLYSADIDVQISRHVKLELDGGQYNVGYYGMPGAFAYSGTTDLPNAPNASVPGYGQNQGGYTAANTYGLGKLKVEIMPHLRLKLGGSYQAATRNIHTITNNLLGNAACTAAGISGPCYEQVMSAPTANDYDGIWSNFAYLNGEFHTGVVTHHVNLGTNGYISSLDQPNRGESAVLGITGLNNPQVLQPALLRHYGNHRSSVSQQQSFIFGDSMDFGRYFTVVGQFSESWIRQKNFNKKPPYGLRAQSSVSGAFSPSVALTFHPSSRLNFYFNWGNSIQPGPEAPTGAANSGESLPIIRSWQYEGGVKWQLNKRLQINLDGFSMARPYAFSNPDLMENGLPVYGYYGQQQDYGIEYQMSGTLTRDISILGGFTWDHAMLKNTGNPLSSFKKVTGVPEWSSDFLLDWHPIFLHGWGFNSNIHYVGNRAANVYNTAWAGEYVTLNLGARYATQVAGHKVVIRGNVDNVTGQNYWASAFADATNGAVAGATYEAALGAPRTWHITASVYF